MKIPQYLNSWVEPEAIDSGRLGQPGYPGYPWLLAPSEEHKIHDSNQDKVGKTIINHFQFHHDLIGGIPAIPKWVV